MSRTQHALRYSDRQQEGPWIPPLTVSLELLPAPSGWHWRLLRDLAKLESGHTPSRYRPDWWGGDVPWLALPDIRKLDGKEAYDTTEYTNASGITNSSARILPARTVCLSRTASVGFVTKMGRPMATSQDFVNWVCGSELDPDFLMYLLIASRDYIRGRSSGAIHKTVYVPTVREFRICCPLLPEQKRIAGILKEQLAAAERARAAAEAQLEAAKALPAAYLREVFEGDEGKAWARVPLKHLLATPLRTGISKPTDTASDIRCVTLSAVRDGQLRIDESKPVALSQGELERHRIRSGAFYLVRGNGNRSLVGRSGRAPATQTPVVFPDLLIEVVPDEKRVVSEFLRFAWDCPEVRSDIEHRATTAAGIYKINLRNLSEVPLPVPNLAPQRQVAGRLERRFRQAANLLQSCRDQLAAIELQPAALLRTAFHGRL